MDLGFAISLWDIDTSTFLYCDRLYSIQFADLRKSYIDEQGRELSFI